ncbi:hypothetical protein BJ170DRAFT_361534 [Xylariales sp. AK1849]|nr:hypothetical protein BJ170DRAFT_361534 [Xylariales sp. AK1849]
MASPGSKPDLFDLGKKLLSEGPHKTLKSQKRIRILFHGVYVADSTSALYVWEHPFYPYYYLPLGSFMRGALHHVKDDEPLSIMDLRVEGRSTDRVLLLGDHVPTEREELRGMVRVEFAAADAWFEEDERIYVHPKDPFKRVEILHSTRSVKVFIEGVEVANTTSAQHLYETGLPTRYYLPATAVDPALLRDSETTTQCPYKGVASYYDVVLKNEHVDKEEKYKAFKDVVWYYRTPTHESAQVAGHLCFYNEKVDIELDGKMLERPKTHFA